MFIIFGKKEYYKVIIMSDGNYCSVDIKICAVGV
jgi:hypothetical protein